MAAFAGAASSRALDPHHGPALYVSAEDSSSSSSSTLLAAESEPVACEGGGEEEGELDLDSPWVAAAEAELRLDAVALEVLSLSVDRQLEEDEIRDNQQRQEDELMALEAIYGNDLDMFENKGGLRCFQIYIRYDVVDGVQLRAKLTSSSACDKDAGYSDGRGHDDRSEEFSYTCNFEFLPPLILTCLLPLSYPSKDPPYFIVTAKWMDGPYVSQLCEMLDTIWAELPEQEVVYHWVEWLRNSSMSYLWVDGNMTLGSDIVTHNGDNRAISRTSSLESIIPLMLSYSSKKHYQVFLDDIHMCMICLNQGKAIDPLLSKHHVIKLNLISKILMHVKEGSVFKLICPDTKCNASIPPYMLKRLLSEEEFERWDRLVLQKALDSMSDAPCHPGKQCITPEEKIQHQQETGKITGKEMAQELLSIKEAYKDVRLCPKCRMAIAKTEGCNKVVCGNCGQYFCFRCGKAIDGYEHFGGDCKLFAQRDTEEWERQMEAMQQKRQRRIQSSPLGGYVRCPKCRARNFKDNDKYIFCWACRVSYCTLCRRKVEDMKAGHYGSLECVGLDKL
ncbi:hypothetical protein PR202_ga19171 [Eleusine coracana subsp. coracana]|uniref:RBR-type E3 ubiquitin transferase n=1 Tax=Eleusine coracana subsp. coracana TaxID=191504 RepID=A0AAV5CTX3_ELECO|nr:hypothetical protein PR202_ga19171 [Eleusine coracana subsp. coracana]